MGQDGPASMSERTARCSVSSGRDTLNIVIVGCGRVGAFLAGQLDKACHAVTIVDLDRGSFVHLPQDLAVRRCSATARISRSYGPGDDKADACSRDPGRIQPHGRADRKQIFGLKRVIAKVRSDPCGAVPRPRISTVSRTTILGTLLEAMPWGHRGGKGLLEKSKQMRPRWPEMWPRCISHRGGGQVGFHLAKALLESRTSHAPESDRRRAQVIEAELGSVVLNAPAARAVPDQAGAQRADAVIAVTGEDPANLIICQLAKLNAMCQASLHA